MSELLQTTRLLGVWSLPGGALPLDSTIGCARASTHTSDVCGDTCGSVAQSALSMSRACMVPFPLSFTGPAPFRCAPQVAQGVVCNFYAALRWHTEGAQGVLSCPLGITELTRACECRC